MDPEQGQQTFSVKGQVINILGFADQEVKSGILCRYRARKNKFPKFLFIKLNIY